jgi:hypothetical protein
VHQVEFKTERGKLKSMVFKAEIHGFYKCFFAKGKWNHFSLGQQK